MRHTALLAALLAGSVGLVAAPPCAADLRLVPKTPEAEADPRDWSRIRIDFSVNAEKDREFRYTLRLYDRQGKEIDENSEKQTRHSVLGALQAKSPGEYRIRGEVRYTQLGGCKVCELTFDIPSVKIEERKPRLWVVLMGFNQVNDENIRPLNFAESDIQALYLVFTRLLGVPPQQVFRFMDKGDPSRNIYEGERSSLASVFHQIKAQISADDTLIFYYSGHGFVADGDWFLASTKARMDGDRLRSEDLIASNDLARLTSVDPAPWHTLVFLDACFSGAATGELVVRGYVPPSWQGRTLERDALGSIIQGSRRVYAAASHNELAYELYVEPGRSPTLARLDPRPPSKVWGHGLFTYALLSAIDDAYRNEGTDLKLIASLQGCSGDQCVTKLTEISRKFSSELRKTSVPLSAIYQRATQIMSAFVESHNKTNRPIAQTPNEFGRSSGESFGFTHHDTMPKRPRR